MLRTGNPTAEWHDLSEIELTRLLEGVDAEEMREWVDALPPQVAHAFGMRVQPIGSAAALVLNGWDVPLFNRVVGLGLHEPISDDVLDQIARTYGPAGHRYLVQMTPAALSPELHQRLEARSWARTDNWVKMVRGADPPPAAASDLRIERVGPAHAEGVAHVVSSAFETPPELGQMFSGLIGRPRWTTYAAFDGDAAVGVGMLFQWGEVGWLTLGATLASHRRRGIQGAIMAQRIRDARDLGCRYLATVAEEDRPDHPNPSYHNMVRAGFRPAYARPNYIYFPPRESATAEA